MEQLNTEISTLFDNHKKHAVFKKFINYIRFPYFKNLKQDLKIEFNYPITFLIGGNGVGKSSILHAIYGAPKNYTVANFWFNTALDPIKDINDNRHCFVYSYTTEFSKQDVEVLKTRIQSKDKKTGKINPDYWEPARPKKAFRMIAPGRGHDKKETSNSGDRWNLIERKVFYMDFRYSLTAYDQYFYFGVKPQCKTLKSKQDIIRKYSKLLREAFSQKKSRKSYSRTAKKPITLTSDELKAVNVILGKDYTEAQITEHNFYQGLHIGFAIKYKVRSGLSYSEAYAGSGETAIVKLVHELMSVDDYSLVLLDEPETSLHPSSQRELIKFILQQIKRKKLQVVIATHSPDIIHGMPKESIKVLYENGSNEVDIINNMSYEQAFTKIGRYSGEKKIIIVEDSLAKLIIEKVIKNIEGASALLDVQFYPGGVSILKQDTITLHAKENNTKRFVIFDGDQRKKHIDPASLSENDKNVKNLDTLIKTQTGQSIKFPQDSNSSHKTVISTRINYLKFYKTNVLYLPGNIPEDIIFSLKIATSQLGDNAELISKIGDAQDTKQKIQILAEAMFESDKTRTASTHDFLIKQWDEESQYYKVIKKIINDIINNVVV